MTDFTESSNQTSVPGRHPTDPPAPVPDTASAPADENAVLFSCPVFQIVKKYQIGRSGQQHSRFIVKHSGGVAILPILPDGRIILIRQFRIAAGKFIYEIPAGMKEKGENPIDTAGRELQEETGYSAGTLVSLPPFYATPGYLSEKIELVLATDLTPGESHLEDGENLSLFIVDLDTARAMIDTGEIEDAKTIIAILLHADRFHKDGSQSCR